MKPRTTHLTLSGVELECLYYFDHETVVLDSVKQCLQAPGFISAVAVGVNLIELLGTSVPVIEQRIFLQMQEAEA